MTGDRCQGPECDRPAVYGSYCDSHLRQIKRGIGLRPLRQYIRRDDLRMYLLESAERYGRAVEARERVSAERDLMRAAKKIGFRLAHGDSGVAA